MADDHHQTGRSFHLVSIQFITSNPDVLMRLTVFDYQEELISIEGKGSLVLPAVLFMRNVSNTLTTNLVSRPTSKIGSGQ